ncbi:YeeE/YedE family protein [Paracoccus sp. (in: a-proteobacteria)]|uniref:YeeE/YedE family protein n=1 Tax=Paracoccus sp. TaxID=267 RepID=UPI0026DF27CF|nr:YeeE/YedE family protein [Paracoccus sp. (in: a-proteobacteria)]MDO5371131.1 YeeE/YedE family protein [Paracoccus sp. (in: a-proteobacteria)]
MSVVVLGLTLGAIFGAAARAGRFCLLRGMKGLVPGKAARDLSALQAFALALAVALAGTQALNLIGGTDLQAALPLRAGSPWLAMLIGGAIFGLGMALANSCGARALVLLAGGNLRSLVVLLCLGLAAQATLTGVLAPARAAVQQLGQANLAGLSLPQLIAGAGIPAQVALAIATILPALALAAFAWPLIRRRPLEAAMAAIIGATVVGGWWITFATDDPFDPKPLTSLSYIGPMGESVLWLMLSTGRQAAFGVAIIGGTLLGAFATALLTRSLRAESFGSPRQTVASALGGALMGFGGVLALGCSIGQGLSGLSTLSIASLVAFAGILAGTALGLLILPQTAFIERT